VITIHRLVLFSLNNSSWEHVWPQFAKFFEMEIAKPQTISMAEMMPLQKGIWEKIVHKYDLHPIPYEKLTAWPFGDFIFGCEYDVMSDTNKIKSFGFTEVMDSEKMFLNLFKEFRELLNPCWPIKKPKPSFRLRPALVSILQSDDKKCLIQNSYLMRVPLCLRYKK
jgi:hypothetical protein